MPVIGLVSDYPKVYWGWLSNDGIAKLATCAFVDVPGSSDRCGLHAIERLSITKECLKNDLFDIDFNACIVQRYRCRIVQIICTLCRNPPVGFIQLYSRNQKEK